MGDEFKLTSEKASPPIRRNGGWSWGPVDGAKLRVLSLGGGIQSTTLALMAAHGEIEGPLPDVALYSPVGDAEATREHIRWLGSGNVLPFPVVELEEPKVSLRQAIENRVTKSGRSVSIPMFLDGKRKGQDRRQCTREYKVDRLSKKQRELLGYKPRQRIPTASCEVWIGYSVDEIVRAGASYQKWTVNRFPLLEARMSLFDCMAWLERNGYPVPVRSKCTFCPFRTDQEWAWLKENEPAAWEEAVKIDRMAREDPDRKAPAYLHQSRKPLDEIDFNGDDDQGTLMICDAGCGV